MGEGECVQSRELKFCCSMLQREVARRPACDGVMRRRFETMRCRVWNEGIGIWEGDEDDFLALHGSWWSRGDFVEGGAVVLLRPLGLAGVPGSGLWARYGRVAERAGGRQEERGTVIVRLREEKSRGWCAHEQVHVAFSGERFRAASATSRVWRSWLTDLDTCVYGVLGRMLGADGTASRVLVNPRGIAYGRERGGASTWLSRWRASCKRRSGGPVKLCLRETRRCMH